MMDKGRQHMKKILAIFLAALSTTAYATDDTCAKLAQKVMELKGGDTAAYGAPPCKAMPDDASKTIMIIGDEIMVVRNDSGEIISHGTFGKTPTGSYPTSIDTAPYWLAPTVRGFGVRFAAYYPHYHGGEQHQTFNMYVIEGEHIRPVLELLITNLYISVEQCQDDTHEDDCTQSALIDKSTISIAKTKHNGYADLIVKARGSSGKATHELTYDANHYVGPADLIEDPDNPVQ